VPSKGIGAAPGAVDWERQPTETVRQYGFFRVYRDLPPLERSLAKVAQQLGCSPQYVQRLSSRNRWVDRVEAFDIEQDRVEQQQRGRRIQEMRQRQANLAATALEKARQGLANLDPESMKAGEIARLLEIAARLERVSRGVIADEPPEHRLGVRINAEEIRAFLKAEGLLREY
jgi:AraC-like DNA-binding protein